MLSNSITLRDPQMLATLGHCHNKAKNGVFDNASGFYLSYAVLSVLVVLLTDFTIDARYKDSSKWVEESVVTALVSSFAVYLISVMWFSIRKAVKAEGQTSSHPVLATAVFELIPLLIGIAVGFGIDLLVEKIIPHSEIGSSVLYSSVFVGGRAVTRVSFQSVESTIQKVLADPGCCKSQPEGFSRV